MNSNSNIITGLYLPIAYIATFVHTNIIGLGYWPKEKQVEIIKKKKEKKESGRIEAKRS
jgi:hypothetical protein